MAPTFYVSTFMALVVLAALGLLLAKGVRVKKRRACPRDQWTTIISNFGTGIPRIFTVTLTARDGGSVEGKYIEQKHLWIFPMAHREGNLEPRLTFRRDWINAIYTVKILPTSDVEVSIR